MIKYVVWDRDTCSWPPIFLYNHQHRYTFGECHKKWIDHAFCELWIFLTETKIYLVCNGYCVSIADVLHIVSECPAQDQFPYLIGYFDTGPVCETECGHSLLGMYQVLVHWSFYQAG